LPLSRARLVATLTPAILAPAILAPAILAPAILAPAILAAAILSAGAAQAASLTVDVANVRNAHGRIRVDICPREKFLDDGCAWHATAPAHPGTVTVVIPDLPPGAWAAQAFHDENANDEIDRGLFGIPREGVGFSRDARIVLSPPKWADAVFSQGHEAQRIRFSLRYWSGPGSPQEWKARHPRD
jgi:uncharacterized protein (DUF2141 family)